MFSSDGVAAEDPGLTVQRFPCRGKACLDIPLVLLHGWGADSRTWQPLVDELSDAFDIAAVDLPGFGASPPGVGRQTGTGGQTEALNRSTTALHPAAVLERLSVTLECLMTALPERCVLVGWSLGGMLATLLAQRVPERVAGLITIATNACYVAQPEWPNAMPAETFDRFRAAFVDDAASCLKRFAALQAHGDDESRMVTRRLREWQQSPDGQQQVAWSESLDLLRALDLRAALQALEQPSLHLFGAGDALVPAAAAKGFAVSVRRQVEVMGQVQVMSQVQVMKGCGHAPHISQPGRVAELIRTFLADVALLPDEGRLELLDKQSVARSFSRAAAQYDSAAHLQRRLGEQLLSRLPDSDSVRRVVDLGCGTGYFLAALQKVFPAAQLLACDLAHGMVAHARQQRPVSAEWLCVDAERLPLADGSVDLIFSNLVFQWCEDLPRLAAELHRTLSPQGCAVFTTLGPGTLAELRQAWAVVDDAVHVNRFPAANAVQGELIKAGFDSVVLETVPEVVHYPVLSPLLRELKTLGANNINRGRPAALTGRARIRALEAAYEAFREPAGLPATWEVYFVVIRKGR